MTSGDESGDQRSDVNPEHELGHRQVALDTEVLQAGISLHPGEVPFDIGARAHQVAPLMEEEQVGQEAFAAPAQVVVDIDGGVEHIADEGQEGIVEVSGVSVMRSKERRQAAATSEVSGTDSSR